MAEPNPQFREAVRKASLRSLYALTKDHVDNPRRFFTIGEVERYCPYIQFEPMPRSIQGKKMYTEGRNNDVKNALNFWVAKDDFIHFIEAGKYAICYRANLDKESQIREMVGLD
jgi:hypothetical protein